MNSLLSNLGPRYSRRNNTTPIILGFLLLIIAIAVLTYFLTRDDEDNNKPEKTPDLPTVSNVGVKRTLNPDSRGSESGTAETYEIGGGKLETYQIEYNTGETFSDLEKKLLSKNVDLTVSWDNGIGFDNVTEIIFKRKIDGTVKRTISYTKSESTGDILKYFQSNQKNLSLEFDNIDDDGEPYNVVGTNTISISVKLSGKDDEIEIFPGTSVDVPVDIGLDDLSSTLEITSSRSQMYYPVTSSFGMSDLEISKDEYTINPSLNTKVPFSTMLKSACDGTLLTDDINFHFIIPDTTNPEKFNLKTTSGDWVKVCSTNELVVTSVSSEASTFEMVKSDKSSMTSGSRYNKFMMIKGDSDLFMYVKEPTSTTPQLYMGEITAMNADEYDSMDMLIGPSGSQCGSGPNKYMFKMWSASKAEGYNDRGFHSGCDGFRFSNDFTPDAVINIRQDPDDTDKVTMYTCGGQIDGEHNLLLPAVRVPNNLGVARAAPKSKFFDDSGNVKDYKIWCYNGKEIKTLTEFNQHIQPIP